MPRPVVIVPQLGGKIGSKDWCLPRGRGFYHAYAVFGRSFADFCWRASVGESRMDVRARSLSMFAVPFDE